jgi:hypothetical protein
VLAPALSPSGRTAVAAAIFALVFVGWFHDVVLHPNSRVPCCVADGTATLRDYWVAHVQHDTPFTFTHDAYNGAPEGSPRSTATVFANGGVQTGFVWGLRRVLGDVAAFNLFLALGLIGSATAMFVLLQRLGCSIVASGLGGYVFGFGPYALERAYAGQPGLAQNWVLVLVVLAMIRVGARRTFGSSILAGAAIALAFWNTAYEGLFAVLIAFGFVAVDVLRAKTTRGRLHALRPLGIAYGLALVSLIPIFVLYARERSTVQAATARAGSDLYTFAARVSDYLVPSARNPLFHWVHAAFPHGVMEHSLFVGYATITLAVVAAVLLARGDAWIRASEERVRTLEAMLVLAVIAFLLSLPPSYTVGAVRIPMPSTILGHFTTNWRVYSRFGEVVGIALIVLAAAGFTALARRPGRRWRYLAPAVVVVVLIELLPGNVHAFDIRKGPAWVEWLAAHPHGIVATYPVSLHQGTAGRLSSEQLTYQQIDHDPGFEIVGESYIQARSRLQAIRTLAMEPSDPMTARILATEGVRYVVIDDDVYGQLGEKPPRLDPRHYTLLKRLGTVGIYSVHAPAVDLEALIEAHKPEIIKLQAGLRPPPSIAVGAGFNPSEPYNGSTGNWMIQDGRLDVVNYDVTPLRVAISAIAFSNGQTRTVELQDKSGRIVSSTAVPGYATRIHFRPVEVKPGTTHLTLVASPGPDAIGASDPRQASVFLTQVVARPVLNP